ncbi:MAG: TIGR02281 family clan AA aspartic protease [Burkholderiales bacterium]|nr:TIGR02281 family clan AA aspartic protease [Burkholderiales bacterium]
MRTLRTAVALWLALLPALTWATQVSLVGLFPGKAVVSIDGGAPRTLAVGQRTAEGVTVVAIGAAEATLEIDGQRRALRVGESLAGVRRGGAPPAAAGQAAPNGAEVVLPADSTGHFLAVGAINDRAVRFLVDSGASMVYLPAEVADRIGLAWRNGPTFTANTAGGPRTAHQVTLRSVRVGAITLTDIDAAVGEGAGSKDVVLLGMSFLSQLSMAREGGNLRLAMRSGPSERRDTRPSIQLKETRGGMFTAEAKINGVALPFLVDTGATLIAIDAATAQRVGINYRNGTPVLASTANGTVRAWRVKFDSVALGPITLFNVDGSVLEGPGIGIGLLGMSFLNRVEMKRDGNTLMLTKRF